MYSAIILAGGAGLRMQQDTPKQFLPLGGKPMILHTLERLEKIDAIGEVVVVCLSEYHALLRQHIAAYTLRKPYQIVQSGDSRQSSTHQGLLAAKFPRVIIHEAARPFVTTREFQALVDAPDENAIYGINIPFTVSCREGERISGLLPRSELVNVQLPQKFGRDAMLRAHERAKAEGKTFTEDASILYEYEHATIAILPGTHYNIKVTEPVDLLTGEIIYKEYIVGRD